MYADVNGFLPTLESNDILSDLSKISGTEQEGYSIDACQFSQITRYGLHEASNDHFFLSIVKKHGKRSDGWKALDLKYVPKKS